MFIPPDKNRLPARILSWVGLLLIAAALIKLQSIPPNQYPAKRQELATAPPGAIKRVIIDAGHGGNDSGAMRAGISEKDLTLDVARRLDALIRANGIATTLTRSGDDTVSLANRAAIANQERDCVFVSIHFDEGSRATATGVQTFYAAQQASRFPSVKSWWPFAQQVSVNTDRVESQSLAGFIQDALVARTQAFNRGTTPQQFYVIANVYHPAVLIEGGFLTNSEDMAKLTSDAYREQMAAAINDGIMRYREISSQLRASIAVEGAGG
jgi:N-acetylmuramoyl-L-alanine amidase